MVFSYAAFFVFLGSSQPIVDEVYDRAEWFAITFGVISAVNGVCVYLVSRRVERLGATRVARTAYFTSLMGYALMTVAALAADGVPAFLLWGALVTVTGTSSTIVTTTAISLALQPMERIAGTASAVRGVGTLGIGSVLASLIDRRIEDTITPMAVGGLVYCAIGFAILSYARGGALDIVDPDAPRRPPTHVEGLEDASARRIENHSRSAAAHSSGPTGARSIRHRGGA